jgi:hypothetical protein
VGGPTNPLLKDGGLSTVVGKGDSNGALSTQLSRLQSRGANPDRCAPASELQHRQQRRSHGASTQRYLAGGWGRG